jgi:hypothetical protein
VAASGADGLRVSSGRCGRASLVGTTNANDSECNRARHAVRGELAAPPRMRFVQHRGDGRVEGIPATSRVRPAGPGGFGLAGIAERVASCGGSLTVGSGQAGGFAVTARLPTS